MTEVQNVSAQLFTKQLPPDAKATYYGCKNDMLTKELTTCVDYIDSDAQIENAFQKQLSLSDYYKGRSVFETMKNDFMDQTMEHQNKPTETLFALEQPKITSSATPIVPVGPRDKLINSIKSKSFFGKSGNSNMILILIVLAIFIITLFLINLKK